MRCQLAERTELSPFFSGSWGDLWVRECEILVLEEIHRASLAQSELTVEDAYRRCTERALEKWRTLIDAGIFCGIESLEDRFGFFCEVFRPEGEYLIYETRIKRTPS